MCEVINLGKNQTVELLELRNQVLVLEVERQQFEAQQNLLNDRAAEYRDFFEDLPDNMIEMARYQRNLQINS